MICNILSYINVYICNNKIYIFKYKEMTTLTKPVNINDESFQRVISSTSRPVVVDFWATWCGPCIMMAPVLEELANDFEGEALITKLDVDQNPVTADKFNIRSIPTILIFVNGEVVDKQVGAVPKSVLTDKRGKVGRGRWEWLGLVK